MKIVRERDQVQIRISVRELARHWGDSWPITFKTGEVPGELDADYIVHLKWSPGFEGTPWLLRWPDHEDTLAEADAEDSVREILNPEEQERVERLQEEARDWWDNVDWIGAAERDQSE